MSAMQRNKGKAGEREAAALIRDLTGWEAKRRVRQHDGDSDILGVPGWSVEVKRTATATHAERARWWAQAVAQAPKTGGELPMVLYRANRASWRVLWPLALAISDQRAEWWASYEYTADTSPEAWAAVARELDARRADREED